MLREKFIRIEKWFFPCRENNYQPPFLESNFLFYCFLFLLILRLAVLPFYLYFPKSVFYAQILAVDLIALANKERSSLGLPLLKESEKLREAARLKAEDMLAKDYFAHKNPEGYLTQDWIKSAGYNFENLGENLAIGFSDSLDVHSAWMDSASHKGNILNTQFRNIGVYVLEGNFQDSKTAVVVQFFASPSVVAGEIVKESSEQSEAQEKSGLTEEIAEENTGLVEEKSGDERGEQGRIANQESRDLLQMSKEERNSRLKLIDFLAVKYNEITENVVFFALIFITFVLFAEALIFIVLSVKNKSHQRNLIGSTMKTFLFMGLAILLALANSAIDIHLIYSEGFIL